MDVRSGNLLTSICSSIWSGGGWRSGSELLAGNGNDKEVFWDFKKVIKGGHPVQNWMHFRTQTPKKIRNLKKEEYKLQQLLCAGLQLKH